MNEPRRKLSFTDLDQDTEDARRLLTAGYQSRGKWDLAQVCAHLNDWMCFPMDGYPPAPLPVRCILWMIKVTFGRRQLKTVLSDGFRDSLPTMPATVHAADENTDAEAVDQLAATIDRFKSFDGPFYASPIYGDLTPEQHLKLQLAHCAHHLSFLSD